VILTAGSRVAVLVEVCGLPGVAFNVLLVHFKGDGRSTYVGRAFSAGAAMAEPTVASASARAASLNILMLGIY